jgi:hypothetical protein
MALLVGTTLNSFSIKNRAVCPKYELVFLKVFCSRSQQACAPISETILVAFQFGFSLAALLPSLLLERVGSAVVLRSYHASGGGLKNTFINHNSYFERAAATAAAESERESRSSFGQVRRRIFISPCSPSGQFIIIDGEAGRRRKKPFGNPLPSSFLCSIPPLLFFCRNKLFLGTTKTKLEPAP